MSPVISKSPVTDKPPVIDASPETVKPPVIATLLEPASRTISAASP